MEVPFKDKDYESKLEIKKSSNIQIRYIP